MKRILIYFFWTVLTLNVSRQKRQFNYLLTKSFEFFYHPALTFEWSLAHPYEAVIKVLYVPYTCILSHCQWCAWLTKNGNLSKHRFPPSLEHGLIESFVFTGLLWKTWSSSAISKYVTVFGTENIFHL